MRLHPLADAVGIHLLRFGVMWMVLEAAPWVGITGWYGGLAVNVVITLLAAVIMTRRGLWVSTGMVVPWRSGLAMAALAPFALEVVAWAVPDGVVDDEPGLALWLLTLLLVGLNEEMFSRGIVLTSLRRVYKPLPAAAITGALFGLQHFSALVLTSRAPGDVAMNVLLSATFGFALAAYQLRFAWLWPLALLHGMADWTTVLTANPLPDWAIGLVHTFYLGYGVWLLRGTRLHARPGMPRTAGQITVPRAAPA